MKLLLSPLLILLWLMGPALGLASKAVPRPNVLLILADDMGYSDLGCYGGEIATPNLDRLAARGLRFSQFYNTARCWPTRGALLTGYYPQQIRMDPPKGRFPEWTRTLPHYLKPLGYRSYHSGKWHIHGAPRALADGGFDRSYRVEDHDRNFAPKRIIEDDQPAPSPPAESGYYTTRAYADHAIRCLREHSEKYPHQPFFSYLAFTVPHFPLQAPPEDVARYRDRYLEGWEIMRRDRYQRQKHLGLIRGPLSEPEAQIRAPSGAVGVEKKIGPGEVVYAVPWEDLNEEQQRFQAVKMAIHAAMVDRMDQEIGRVLDQIQRMGQLDHTIVLFLSDNGASAEILVRGDGHDPAAVPGSAASYLCLGPGWSTACNTPFRRHKIWVHEGGISTPLIVHWPDGIQARGEWRETMGHVIDLVPTLLEVVGVRLDSQAPGAPSFPGRSLVPAFAKNAPIPRQELYFHHSGNRALRTGDWKLVSASDQTNRWELYDLTRDRGETADLSSQYPERVREMAQRWQTLTEEFQRQAGNSTLIEARPSREGK